jgi:hypothetical protein
MKYNVYIQNNLYKTVENNNIANILLQITKDIESGLVNIDTEQPHNIRIEPINE